MSPRYGRTNRRYNVKLPKEKASLEKRLSIQSIISLSLLGILSAASFFVPRSTPKKILYQTYTLKQWQDTVTPVVSTVKDTSFALVKSYNTLIEGAKDRFGIKPKKDGAVKAQEAPSKEAVPASDTTAQNPPVEDIPKESEKPVIKWQPPVWATVSSPFGARIHPVNGSESVHTGVDLAASEGTAVVAAAPGTVKAVGYDGANGNYVIIDHGDGITSVYAHLMHSCVEEGASVSPEVKIGEVGSTGISTGPHLHFEIKVGGTSVNPWDYTFFKEG